MAVGIREFSTPNFAQHIPGEDKEERPSQKIEKFATFLNELPWFPKGFFGRLFGGNEDAKQILHMYIDRDAAINDGLTVAQIYQGPIPDKNTDDLQPQRKR